MNFQHLALVLFTNLIWFNKRDIAMWAEHISQFLFIIHLNGAFPIQDIEIWRHTADSLLSPLVDNTEYGLSIFVEPRTATWTPAVQIRILLYDTDERNDRQWIHENPLIPTKGAGNKASNLAEI